MNKTLTEQLETALEITKRLHDNRIEELKEAIQEYDSADELAELAEELSRVASDYSRHLERVEAGDSTYNLANVFLHFFVVSDPYGYDEHSHISTAEEVYRALYGGFVDAINFYISEINMELVSSNDDKLKEYGKALIEELSAYLPKESEEKEAFLDLETLTINGDALPIDIISMKKAGHTITIKFREVDGDE